MCVNVRVCVCAPSILCVCTQMYMCVCMPMCIVSTYVHSHIMHVRMRVPGCLVHMGGLLRVSLFSVCPHTSDDNMMVVATPADGTFLLYRGVCISLSVCLSVCLSVYVCVCHALHYLIYIVCWLCSPCLQMAIFLSLLTSLFLWSNWSLPTNTT